MGHGSSLPPAYCWGQAKESAGNTSDLLKPHRRTDGLDAMPHCHRLNLTQVSTLGKRVPRGTLAAAAAHLGYTPGAVSQHLASLESTLGVARGGGRIVNVSSVLGLIPAPTWRCTPPRSTRSRGCSESLDHEVRQHGVRVLLVEPACTSTGFEANSLAPEAALPSRAHRHSSQCAASHGAFEGLRQADPQAEPAVRLRLTTPQLPHPVH